MVAIKTSPLAAKAALPKNSPTQLPTENNKAFKMISLILK